MLSYTSRRFKNGATKDCVPSRFINDIDRRLINVVDSFGSFETHSRSRFSDYDYAAPHTSWLDERISRTSLTTSTLQPPAEIDRNPAPAKVKPELSEGSVIDHIRFGAGTVKRIDTSGSDAKIVVDFEEVGTKTLLLKFAKFTIKE